MSGVHARLHAFIEKSSGALRRNGDVWTFGASEIISYPEEARDWMFELEDNSFWFAHRNDCILELVRAFPPADVLLDIGGGNGVVTAALQRAGIESVLLEPGGQGVQNALKRGVSPVIHSSLDSAGFREGALGAAGLFDVLEHIPDEDSFLKSVRSTMKTDGKLYVTVPAYRFLWSVEDDHAGHFRRYSLNSLNASFARNGFRMEYGSYIFSPLPLPVFLARTLPEKFGMHAQHSPADHSRSHSASPGVVSKILCFLLKPELFLLRNEIRIPFGTSCIACARAV